MLATFVVETNPEPHPESLQEGLGTPPLQHDQVLRVIAEFVRKQVPDDMRMVADLKEQYQFPTCLSYTDLCNLW